MKPKTIVIAGGGLAGLFLGIRLRQRQIPVVIHESADYPRHRVCGEFISGTGQNLLTQLPPKILRDSRPNRSTAWFLRDRLLFARQLPFPATGLSRFQLDRRLADLFRELDGQLHTRQSFKKSPAPGTVFATGRRRGSGNLIGLKLHARNFPLQHDLSMHLGKTGYVGVSRIENDTANICGLFRLRRDLKSTKPTILLAYLRANRLHCLADSLETADIDPASITATAACDFSHSPPDEIFRLGDAQTAIPPFAGNGISMALEAAEIAAPFLHRYATGEIDWDKTRRAAQRALASRFRLRLALARLLHPRLLNSSASPTLTRLSTTTLFPYRLLFHLLR